MPDPSFTTIMAVAAIGVRIGKGRDSNATALVGAAVLAMVIFPKGAQSLPARSERVVARGGAYSGSGEWHTASTLFPSGSRTKPP
jgi:hypothetical protein